MALFAWLKRYLLSAFLVLSVLGLPLNALAEKLWQLPYPLTSDAGKLVQLAQWSGRPAIVTMEYSQSSLVCSVTLAYLKELQDMLDARGESVDFVIISLDPKNDTPQAWSAYRQTFGLKRANWHFLTASEADTPAIARALNVRYQIFDGLIIHRLRVMRFDGEGRMLNVVRSHYEDLSAFLDQSAKVH